MLSKVVIKNFKSYGAFSIDFNPDLNIIVGDNDAGKSTLLEAINLVLTCQLNNRHISNEINPYIFNTNVIAGYLKGIKEKKPTPLPAILIEAYFNDPENCYSSLKGTNNTESIDCPGVYLSIEFDPSFEEEYKSYIEDEDKINTIPIEYYTFKWFSFANNSITYRSIPFNSALIDTSTIKLQNGTDKYIYKIIQDTLEVREKTELALNYRQLKESFAAIPSIQEINTKLNTKKGDITDKSLSISVDISQKNNWDTIITSYLDDVPFDFIGKGEQSSIKMKMALESNNDTSSLVMIEEPENHLSYGNMNRLISSIKDKNEGKQVILTTHSSFVLNKLDISKMVLLNSDKSVITFNDLDNDTKRFFMKLPGYDTLRIILCDKVILVEGPSDELVVQRAYKDLYNKLPIEEGVDIFCVDALSFKRFLDLSIALKKKIYVITDNDGDIEKNIKQKYDGYLNNEFVTISYDPDTNYNTLEPQLIKANIDDTSVLKEILGHPKYSDERLTQYMINNKTDCALKIFEAVQSINMPRYILDAIKNKVIIAAAGSGKTTYLVQETIRRNTSRVLIVTFTNKNKEEIIKKFIQIHGYLPANVNVNTWYSFLLSDWVRPYQNSVYPEKRIESIFFRDRPASYYIKKTNIRGYYFNERNEIDKDRLSDFAIQCFEKSDGKVIKRLEEIYDYIFIDEVQDMSGYDLDIFHIFFCSRINMVLVGDIRQATYSTTNSSKNKKYRGINIIDYFKEQEKRKRCHIEYLYINHRCNQAICDFSDNLFANLPPTKSMNSQITGHDGLFIINPKEVSDYIRRFNPQVLRYDSRTKIVRAINFGESKGLTFDRVLIKPTKKMEHYLKTGEMFLDDITLAKFYVAVTRSRYSVGFISNIESINVSGIERYYLN